VRFQRIEPPRSFQVGRNSVLLRHVATLRLEPDELLTLLGDSERELDIVSKKWGFYVTPSLQHRLKSNGLRAALMRNRVTRQLFVVAVYEDEIESWTRYMSEEEQELVVWLDSLGEGNSDSMNLGSQQDFPT